MKKMIKDNQTAMIPDERKERLLELLRREKFLSASDIARELFVSEATARRDINDLASLNLANKVYGGISYIEQNQIDVPNIIRNTTNIREKVQVANMAKKFIKDGMSIFIHSGTTCFRLVEALDDSITINVLTDDLKIAYRLSKFPKVKVELTPGFVREGFDCVYGSQISRYIEKRNADLFFFSCHSFNFKNSAMTINEKDIDIVNSFIENSKKTFLLLDDSKFYNTSFYQLCNLNDIDYIVSNFQPTQEELQICNNYKIQFINR